MVISSNQVFTKRGNRNFKGERPKDMSRARYGILINYYDWRAVNKEADSIPDFSPKGIKELYYEFYEPLRHYGRYGLSNPSGYLRFKSVCINPVGALYSTRPFLTEYGKRRLEQLRKNKAKKNRKLKKEVVSL